MRTALMLIFSILAGTGGEIATSRAMKNIGEVHDFSPRSIFGVIGRAFLQPSMWLGFAGMTAGFFAMLTLLSWEDVSFVVPATALSYAVGAMGAKWFLKERVSPTRWAGVWLVCAGVVLVWAGGAPSSALPTSAAVAGPAIGWSFRSLSFWIRALVFTGAVIPFVYYILAIVCARRFFSQPTTSNPDFTPPVSVLKPVRGLDPGAYENFSSFCRQDYPNYEILFCVNDSSDPAIPVLERVIREHPEVSVRILVGAPQLGASNKVNKLCRLVKESRYDIFIISDGDIRVEPNYLREISKEFRNPKVGGVTCMYLGLLEPHIWADMEEMGETGDAFAGVMVARVLEGIRFTMGATMACTRARLAEIGGFEALVDAFTDDFELGNRIAANGWEIVLSHHVIHTVYPPQNIKSYFRHQLQWAMTTLHARPKGHFGLLLTHGIAWSSAAAIVAIASGMPNAAWIAAAYLGGYTFLRIAMAWVVGVKGLNDPVLRRSWWLLPLRDAISFLIWVASYFSSEINWRGTRYHVVKGKLIPVEPAPAQAVLSPAKD